MSEKNWEERKFFWTTVSLFLNWYQDSFHTSIHLSYYSSLPSNPPPLCPPSSYSSFLLSYSNPDFSPLVNLNFPLWPLGYIPCSAYLNFFSISPYTHYYVRLSVSSEADCSNSSYKGGGPSGQTHRQSVEQPVWKRVSLSSPRQLQSCPSLWPSNLFALPLQSAWEDGSSSPDV